MRWIKKKIRQVLALRAWLPRKVGGEVFTSLLTVFTWLVIVSFLRWPPTLALIWLWLGGLVGMFLLEIDHLFYLLLIRPYELTSLRLRRLLDQHRFKEALVLLVDTRQERIKLSFHHALFQVVLLVLALFVLTSTISLFGAGLVMGMILHLLKDELGDLFVREEHLRRWLFWTVKTEVSFHFQKIFVMVMVLAFLGLNLLLI